MGEVERKMCLGLNSQKGTVEKHDEFLDEIVGSRASLV